MGKCKAAFLTKQKEQTNENFAKVLQSECHLVELADFFLAFHVGFKVCENFETENKQTNEPNNRQIFITFNC